jgi:glucose/arabinose dehydrogenase
MPRLFAPPRPLASLALLAMLQVSVATTGAATLPAGFSESVYASGLANATAMQFAPDGRLFVCQQDGRLRVVKNGVLLPTPFIDLDVDDSGERGLLGVAFDPNFAVNQHLYVYYTFPGSPRNNRISRFTANGDVVVPGSEFVLMNLESLSAGNHNGGAMNFGPDGKLYVAVGENAVTANSQSLSNRLGKILRLNPDGSIPADNPTTFQGLAGSPAGDNRAIWAVGLRNPFTFAFNPGGPVPMFINDVGGGAFEEINEGIAGANYGWPNTEGNSPPGLNFTYPRYTYANDASTCALTGGDFYGPANVVFPGEYLNDYFFADFCAGWIRRLDTATNMVTGFATGISAPVDIKVGTDGFLYYLARGANAVYRVAYGDLPPGISTHPANATVSPGEAATFSVVATGTPPFTYQWQRFTGANWTNVGTNAASYTVGNPQIAADNGARFRVNVANAAGNVFSNEAVLTVTNNQAPVATITLPAAGSSYAGGQTIAFAGTGTDAEDGPRPASAFTWRVDFHHDTHSHPFLPATSGLISGTFVIPTSGETAANVWYRIVLTVSDSAGRTHTVQRDVAPRVVRLTLATSPAGLQLRLDGQPVATPHAFDSVVGVVRAIDALDQQVGSVGYAFHSWSDGGARGRAINTPPVASTYTARFSTVAATGPPSTPTGFAMIANGLAVRVSWNRAPGATGYRLEAGTATGLVNLFNGDVGDLDRLETVVPPGTYFARVRAVNPFGVSGASAQASVTVSGTAACATPPPAPANYTAQTGGLLVALSWTRSPAATGYVLEAGTAPSLANLLATPLGNVSSFTATAGAGTYYTRLRAVNACGASPPSAEVPITLGCSVHAVVPGGLTVTKAGGVALFTWQPPLGATGFRMLVGSAPGLTNLADLAVGAATAQAVNLAGVPPGTYYVRVAAMSACGLGAPSNEVALTVP